jgi:uncharacterized membrane protein
MSNIFGTVYIWRNTNKKYMSMKDISTVGSFVSNPTLRYVFLY